VLETLTRSPTASCAATAGSRASRAGLKRCGPSATCAPRTRCRWWCPVTAWCRRRVASAATGSDPR
jgi:hypothetical protein